MLCYILYDLWVAKVDKLIIIMIISTSLFLYLLFTEIKESNEKKHFHIFFFMIQNIIYEIVLNLSMNIDSISLRFNEYP